MYSVTFFAASLMLVFATMLLRIFVAKEMRKLMQEANENAPEFLWLNRGWPESEIVKAFINSNVTKPNTHLHTMYKIANGLSNISLILFVISFLFFATYIERHTLIKAK